MTHWTQVLLNVSVVEFVLLAALTTLQWARHRIRGAGWVALSFALLGGVSLAVKIEPSLITNQNVAKWLIALLLLVPYCLFRFAASFRTPSRTVRALALAVTAGMVAFTFSLQYLPTGGSPPPPNFLAYRVFFGVAFGFLFAYVVVRLFMAGRGEPPIAATRMHLLGVAVAGLEVQVVVAALWLQGPTVRLVTLGPHRGDGRPVPDGAGAPFVPAGLLEPEGGRGVPPRHRRIGVRRRLEGRGRAPAAPRLRPRGCVQGRPPGR